MPKRTREEIYDEEISPLMTKIIQVCKDAGIPMVCDFALDDDWVEGEDDPPRLHCTTSIVPASADEKSKRIAEAAKIERHTWAAFTIHADGRREQVAGSHMPEPETL